MAAEEVRWVFEMPMADKVWNQLAGLGLNADELKANFNGYYQGRRKSDPLLKPRLIFLEWGVEQLQPVINRKLHRDYGHPTFYAMMEHCLAKEIADERAKWGGRIPQAATNRKEEQ